MYENIDELIKSLQEAQSPERAPAAVVEEPKSYLGQALTMGLGGLGDAIQNSYGNGGGNALKNIQGIYQSAQDDENKMKLKAAEDKAAQQKFLLDVLYKKKEGENQEKDLVRKKDEFDKIFNQKKEQFDIDQKNKLKVAEISATKELEKLKKLNEEKNLLNTARLDEKNRLNDKDVETITAFDESKRKMSEVLNMLKGNDNWTGPIDGRIPDYMLDKDQIRFRSELGKIFDKYRVAVTGAGAGQNELSMLLKRIPSETDTFENFKSKAESFLNSVDEDKKTFLANKTKQGKNTKPFLGQENSQIEQRMPASMQAAPYGQTVMQNGKTYMWNGTQYVEAK